MRPILCCQQNCALLQSTMSYCSPTGNEEEEVYAGNAWTGNTWKDHWCIAKPCIGRYHYTVSSDSIGFLLKGQTSVRECHFNACSPPGVEANKFETFEIKTGSDFAKKSRRCGSCCVRLAILLEWNACRWGT
jgi:hypothetical protein